MSPTRTDRGTRSRKRSTAVFAAASRVGATSVASIEREVSTTRTTVELLPASTVVTVGRAAATQSTASAVPNSVTVSRLRQ